MIVAASTVVHSLVDSSRESLRVGLARAGSLSNANAYRLSGKRGKNDANDAAAICEVVTRPNMRFVPVKNEHQQSTLCLHHTRQGFVIERTAA